jgi:hypothetical protein
MVVRDWDRQPGGRAEALHRRGVNGQEMRTLFGMPREPNMGTRAEAPAPVSPRGGVVRMPESRRCSYEFGVGRGAEGADR